METLQSEEIAFVIRIRDLQDSDQEKLGRELTEEEIEVAKKGLEWGLLTGIDIVYDTIFTEMI